MYFCVHDFLYLYSKYLPTLCKGRYDSQAKKNQIYVTLTKFMTKIISYIFFSQMDFSNPHTYTHREANDEQRHMQICFRRYVTFE